MQAHPCPRGNNLKKLPSLIHPRLQRTTPIRGIGPFFIPRVIKYTSRHSADSSSNTSPKRLRSSWLSNYSALYQQVNLKYTPKIAPCLHFSSIELAIIVSGIYEPHHNSGIWPTLRIIGFPILILSEAASFQEATTTQRVSCLPSTPLARRQITRLNSLKIVPAGLMCCNSSAVTPVHTCPLRF